MKHALLTTLACLIFGFSAGAQICRFTIEKRDKSSGDTIRTSLLRLGEEVKRWNILLEQKGNKYFVSLVHALSPVVTAHIQPGDEFFLKLDDGTVITLAADQEYTPAHYYEHKSCVIHTKGEISVAQLEQLSKAHLTEVKLTIGGTDYVQSSMSEQQVIKVSNVAKCLLILKDN